MTTPDTSAAIVNPAGAALDDIMRMAPVIPVLTIDRADDAVPLARALVAGGLPVLEVTLRTAAARDALAAIRDQVPDAVVGFGTILNAEDLEGAERAGARFGVSPGLTQELAVRAARSGLPFLPGVATASEVMAARAHGFTRLKFFPAGAAGGRAMLRGFAGPFADVAFCPTGGVGEDNLADYLALANVVCVGGSWLASAAEIGAGRWGEITARARRARELASAAGVATSGRANQA